MKTRAAYFSLLLAAFLAAGSQWDLAQVFAWGRMFALNTQTMSVRDAVVETFNPARKCHLCRAVEQARHQQDASQLPDAKFQKQILLAFAPKPLFIARSVAIHTLHPLDWAVPAGDKAAPPVPPPRAA